MQATAETAMGGGFRRNSVSELKLKNRCTGSTNANFKYIFLTFKQQLAFELWIRYGISIVLL